MFSSCSDDWSTPKDVYDALNKEFNFNYDPCPLKAGFDGLFIGKWNSCSFVNPPYSNIKDWAKRSYEEYLKGNTVVMLIPSRKDTKWWHEYIMKATEIRFIKGRLKFGDSKNSAPFPSCVVIFKNKG